VSGFYRDGRFIDTSETPWGESYTPNTPAAPKPAPAPDIEAVRREAFVAGWDAHRREAADGMNSTNPLLDALTAWLSQRRGETP
jgi:hypothetical protein